MLRYISASDGIGFGYIDDPPAQLETNGLAAVSASALVSNVVLKASSGLLYDFHALSNSVDLFIMLFDAAALPANGVVSPSYSWRCPAQSSIDVSFGSIPWQFSNGCVLAASSTGAFTLAASTSAVFSGRSA